MTDAPRPSGESPPAPGDLHLELFREVVEQMNFGAVVVEPRDDNRRFVIRLFNRGAQEIESLPASAAVGRTVSEVFPYVRTSGLYEILRQVATDGQARHHQTRLYDDGELTHCHNDHVLRLASGHLAIIYYDSTERTKTEEALRLRSAGIEQSIDGIGLADMSMRLKFVNSALAQMHGYTPEQIIGHPITIFHPAGEGDRGLEDILEIVRERGAWAGELLHQRRDGQSFPTRMTLSLFHDGHGEPEGLLAVVRDVSEIKRVEEQLRLLNAAVSDATEGIMITDALLERPGPRIVFVNHGFTALTGYEPHEVIGLTPRVLQGPKTDRAVLANLSKALLEGRNWQGETINYRKDGTEFAMEWNISAVHNARGETTHYVAIQRDVTERKRAEEAARHAEQLAIIARTAVTYNHEINNPLGAITGSAELLLAEEGDPERAELLRNILVASQRIASVIERIEEMSRPVFRRYVGDQMMLDLEDGETGGGSGGK